MGGPKESAIPLDTNPVGNASDSSGPGLGGTLSGMLIGGNSTDSSGSGLEGTLSGMLIGGNSTDSSGPGLEGTLSGMLIGAIVGASVSVGGLLVWRYGCKRFHAFQE